METLTDIEFISLVKLTESGMIDSENLLNENAIMDKFKNAINKGNILKSNIKQATIKVKNFKDADSIKDYEKN